MSTSIPCCISCYFLDTKETSTGDYSFKCEKDRFEEFIQTFDNVKEKTDLIFAMAENCPQRKTIQQYLDEQPTTNVEQEKEND